jgi:transcriptional/translational regulatory protein YebC/TACO1
MKYEFILIDADDTLFDFQKTAEKNFEQTCKKLGVPYKDGYYEIYTEPDDLSAVCEDLEAKGYKFESAEVEKVPATYVSLSSDDDKKFMNLLLENLEENEDIVNVWHNWDEE